MHTSVVELSDELVAALFHESPLSAFLMGLDDVDANLSDLSRDAQLADIATYTSLAARARAIAQQTATMDDQDVMTLHHIELTCENYVRRLTSPLVEFTVTNFPSAPLSALISQMPQLPVASVFRQHRYVNLLTQFPRYLEQATSRHRDGLAKGLTPTRRGVQNALNQIDTILSSSDLGGIKRTFDNTAVQDALDTAISVCFIPSITLYRDVLEREFLPVGRSDDHCGLSHLAGGDEIYSSRTEIFTWSKLSPQAIHDVGQNIMAKLHREFIDIGTRVWGLTDFAGILDKLVNDPKLRFDSSDEIINVAVAAVLHAEHIAPNFFGVVPSTPCAVAPIPDALAEGAAVAYYYGGAVDGSRPGTYFLNTTHPTKRDRHTAEAIAYHEAVPGHHFQLTIAQEMANSHLLYRVTRDVTNSEGWGLYTERLADEMGLYSDDIALLGMLTCDAMRAARLVVDTGIHALKWSRQDAINWMCANVPMSPLDITQEIDRYIVNPGQALAYMFGRLEIERIRELATTTRGAQFDLRAFHDKVLAIGPIALPAFSAEMTRWMSSEA